MLQVWNQESSTEQKLKPTHANQISKTTRCMKTNNHNKKKKLNKNLFIAIILLATMISQNPKFNGNNYNMSQNTTCNDELLGHCAIMCGYDCIMPISLQFTIYYLVVKVIYFSFSFFFLYCPSSSWCFFFCNSLTWLKSCQKKKIPIYLFLTCTNGNKLLSFLIVTCLKLNDILQVSVGF